MTTEFVSEIQQRIEHAVDNNMPLTITGSGSKSFYGRRNVENEDLTMAAFKGITSYEPTELVITARCGTTIAELEATLAEHSQILPFEPPHFQDSGTVGGMIASGLSGPRRAYAGAVRDAVLGVHCLNGKGEALHFGGQVMKNVAGYDIARLMTGSLGTLGVILEASIKVIPMPECETTLSIEIDQAGAVTTLSQLSGKALPVSGSCHYDGKLYIRLSGNEAAVHSARSSIGGNEEHDGKVFWASLRDQQHPFFESKQALWRLSLAPASSPLELAGDTLLEWGGAQRWLKTSESAEVIRQLVSSRGGHATLFRNGEESIAPFHPLAPGLLKLHRQLKQAFDPFGILNPGRMYAEL